MWILRVFHISRQPQPDPMRLRNISTIRLDAIEASSMSVFVAEVGERMGLNKINEEVSLK